MDAYSSETGKQLYVKEFADPIEAFPLAISDSTVLIRRYRRQMSGLIEGGDLLALEPNTGRLRWTFELDLPHATWTHQIKATFAHDRIYLRTPQVVFTMDEQSGEVVGRYDVSEPPTIDLLVTDDDVFLEDLGGVHILNLELEGI